jgi:hypothetical protein
MTTATPLPDGIIDADTWQHDHPQPYRVVFGVPRGIGGRDDVIVGTTAIQYADGTIDGGHCSSRHPPHKGWRADSSLAQGSRTQTG